MYPLANLPTTRDQFKAMCLRRLGAPVLQINLDEDQIEDCVNMALQFWWSYSMEGNQKNYYKYQLQAADFDNKYIQLPSNIIGAVKIFDITSALRQDDLFNIRYQIVLNDLYTLTSVSMVPFYQTFMHLQFLEQLLIGQQPVRYNRHDNKFYIDMDWTRFSPGDFIIIECYNVIDPDSVTEAWSDRNLLKLAAAYMKRDWGQVLIKFNNFQMGGGITFNGQMIYSEGVREVQEAENEIMSIWNPIGGPEIG